MQGKKENPKLGGWATVAARGKVRPPSQGAPPNRRMPGPPPGLKKPNFDRPPPDYRGKPNFDQLPPDYRGKPNSRFQREERPRYNPDPYMKYKQNEPTQQWNGDYGPPAQPKSYNRGFNKFATEVEDEDGVRKPRPMRSDGVSWWRNSEKTVKHPPIDNREQDPNMDPKYNEVYTPVRLDKISFTLKNQKKIKSLNHMYPRRRPSRTMGGQLSFHSKSKIYRNYVKVPFPPSEKYAPDDPFMQEIDAKAKRLLQRGNFGPKKLSLPNENAELERESYLTSLQEREKKEKEIMSMYEKELTEEELRQVYEEEMYLKTYEEETMMREMYERELYERELYEAEILAQARNPAEREAIERDIYMRQREMYEAEMYERALWESQVYGDLPQEYGAEYGHYGADYGPEFDYGAYGGRPGHY